MKKGNSRKNNSPILKNWPERVIALANCLLVLLTLLTFCTINNDAKIRQRPYIEMDTPDLVLLNSQGLPIELFEDTVYIELHNKIRNHGMLPAETKLLDYRIPEFNFSHTFTTQVLVFDEVTLPVPRFELFGNISKGLETNLKEFYILLTLYYSAPDSNKLYIINSSTRCNINGIEVIHIHCSSNGESST